MQVRDAPEHQEFQKLDSPIGGLLSSGSARA
jgi:hypothetical protein